MNILGHKLVRKYFWPKDGTGVCQRSEHGIHIGSHDECSMCRNQAAFNVLQAMQEPIKKGDRYLSIYSAVIEECVAGQVTETDDWHTQFVRLPDRFQTKPDPVEEKIKATSENLGRAFVPVFHVDESRGSLQEIIARQLRELVELVRSEKRKEKP